MAQLCREEGNELFRRGMYRAAVDKYTEGIALERDNAKLYSNRALCYRKLQKPEQALSDAERALELDPKSVKARYYFGLCLREAGRHSEAVPELRRAYALCEDSTLEYGKFTEEVYATLCEAERELWDKRAGQRLAELEDLTTFAHAAIKKYTSSVKSKERTNAAESGEKLIACLFREKSQWQTSEVPEYYCCSITMAVMRDPVIVSSGHTFERSAILEHIESHGPTCPITRKPIDKAKIVPNLALKSAIDDFLRQNSWAYME